MTEVTLRPHSGDTLGIVGQLDAADQRTRSIACGLTEAQAHWRPSSAHDSVADALVRHLEWLRRTVPVLREAVRGVRSTWCARLGEVRSGWWWQLVVPLVVRLAEWAPVVPLGDSGARLNDARPPIRAIMGEILELHGEVRRLAREGELRDLRTASVRLPTFPTVRAPIDVALSMVPSMARRHLKRAERVRLHRDFPRR